MSDRAQQHHQQRIEDAVREEITALLEGGLADPRIGLVTVNVVQLMRGKIAHVYVSVQGTDEEAEQTMEALRAAKGYVRHELAERLQMHKPPDLVFHLDRSDEIQKKIDAVRQREQKKQGGRK